MEKKAEAAAEEKKTEKIEKIEKVVIEEKVEKKNYKNFILSAAGILSLLLGVTFILVWWADIMSLFRSIIGLGLALAGMLVLYSLDKK